MIRQADRAGSRSRLVRDERGIALVEFALVLPFLFLIFISGYQLMDAISAYRKVGSTVRTLADLTSQNATMSPAQATDILNASQKVMAPYSVANAALRISQIQVDSTGRATVSWSRALNDRPRIIGSDFTMPAALNQPSKYYIYSEIAYTYVPKLASALVGTIPFKQTIFMSPRGTTAIPCDTCTNY